MTSSHLESKRALQSASFFTRKRIGALVFLAISLFYGAQIPDIQQLPVDELEVMNARSLPWALTLLGIGLSVLLFAIGGRSAGARTDALPIERRDLMVAGLLLFWTALYAVLLLQLGFWLATFAFLWGGFALLGERGTRGLLIALCVATALWALLQFALGVYLPPGTILVWLR